MLYWIDAANTGEAGAVTVRMKEMPINDFFAKNGRIRADGRTVHESSKQLAFAACGVARVQSS